MKAKRGAYTLLELMIVVAMMGILLSIAVPKLSAMVHRSKEGATKTNLSGIRSALQIYFADNEGVYPEDALNSLTATGKYMQKIPAANIFNTFHHPASANVETISAGETAVSDSGGWSYVSDRSDPRWGHVYINCNHPDLAGNAWSLF